MMQLLPSALSSSIYLTLALIVVFVVFRYWLFYLSSSKPIFYYLILFPGVIIHELSHTLLCLITFTRIRSLKLFSKNGGFVVHDKPKYAVINFAISVAPMLTGTAILFFTMRYLYAHGLAQTLGIRGVFLIYFLSSVAITMLPSKQDFLNASSVYIAIIIALICYYFLSPEKIFFNYMNTLILFGCLVLLIINIIFYGMNKLLWKSR